MNSIDTMDKEMILRSDDWIVDMEEQGDTVYVSRMDDVPRCFLS